MACGNHDTTVKVLCSRHIRNAWRRGDVKQISIRSGRRDSCCQRVFKHVAASSGILSDHDPCLVILSVIPPQISSYFKCMLHSQHHIGLTAKPVCSKIFCHSLLNPPCHLTYLPIFLHNRHFTLSIIVSMAVSYKFFLLHLPECIWPHKARWPTPAEAPG